MKYVMCIVISVFMVACATPKQKEQNQYIRTIQKAQRAIEFGQSEIKTGKATMIRGQRRVQENEAIILETQKKLDNMNNVVIETVIQH